jgi:hypothetical protein
MNKPDRVTRLALRSAGFRWNVGGGYWWRHNAAMEAIKAADLEALLAPVAAGDNAEQPQAAAV